MFGWLQLNQGKLTDDAQKQMREQRERESESRKESGESRV